MALRFISSVEHAIPWASTTRAGPPRPGAEFAVCWCSELARVGVDLARGRLLTRYLGRAGCLSTPMDVCIKQGAESPVGFEPGVGWVGFAATDLHAAKHTLLLATAQRVSPTRQVTDLSRAPWFCPIGSVELGAVPVGDIINCPDAVRATRFPKTDDS